MSSQHSKSLTGALLRYSAAASLVTAGLTAMSPNTGLSATTLNPGETLAINIDNAGVDEFTLGVSSAAVYLKSFSESVEFRASGTEGVWIYPYRLNQGYTLNSEGDWLAPGSWAALSIHDAVGQWNDLDGSTPYYLGVKFKDDRNATQTGWVELVVTNDEFGQPQTPNVVVNGWGVNSPSAVDLAGAHAMGNLSSLVAGAFAALGGALTWLRRKLRK